MNIDEPKDPKILKEIFEHLTKSFLAPIPEGTLFSYKGCFFKSKKGDNLESIMRQVDEKKPSILEVTRKGDG